jgi:CCR4-NOT transcription complex subunit 6
LNNKNFNANIISVCRFDFKGIIDYIFYSKQSMTPLGLLGPLAPEWLRENKVVGCPHPHVPSGN